MLFEKITDGTEKIRINDPDFWTGFKWVTLRKGSKIDLPHDQGKRLGYEIVKETTKPKKRLEIKKEDNGLYIEKIQRIRGIGEKTAKDLIKIYPTEKKLIQALKSGYEIPIRDDLAKLIKKKFRVK